MCVVTGDQPIGPCFYVSSSKGVFGHLLRLPNLARCRELGIVERSMLTMAPWSIVKAVVVV